MCSELKREMSDKSPVEIEVKIPIENFGELFEKLKSNGFVRTMVRREVDTYFNSVYYDLKENDKALRIRRTTDKITGKEWAELNCKGPKLDDISMSRKEYETLLENPDEIEKILAEIGFLPVDVTVDKTRYYFSKGEITACIDQVEGLGDFLELEILEQGEFKREAGLKEIENVMNDIGYTMADTVQTSYLVMLYQVRADSLLM